MQARSTSRRSPNSSNESELQFHASGFMVRVQGSCTKESLARFRHFLKLRRLSPSHAELTDAVERARQKYFEEREKLYVCDERPCRGRFGFDSSDAALATISRQRG